MDIELRDGMRSTIQLLLKRSADALGDTTKAEFEEHFPELLAFALAYGMDKENALELMGRWCLRYHAILMTILRHDKYRDLATEEDIINFAKGIPYKTYLKTEHWRELRADASTKAGHRCQVCNKKGLIDVHHRTYERLGAEKLEDVIVLCRECHSIFHSNGKLVSDWREDLHDSD
jgi:uncharacterized protein with PIN domain